MTKDYILRHERHWISDQTHHLVQIREQAHQRYRVTIHANSYVFQSSALVELWTGRGWWQVVSMDGAELFTDEQCKTCVYGREQDTKGLSLLQDAALEVWVYAQEVIG